jgi:hypothetical protein
MTQDLDRLLALEDCAFVRVDYVRPVILRLQAAEAALQGLIDGVVPEVNEKGAGGFLLARLSDARAYFARKEPS